MSVRTPLAYTAVTRSSHHIAKLLKNRGYEVVRYLLGLPDGSRDFLRGGGDHFLHQLLGLLPSSGTPWLFEPHAIDLGLAGLDTNLLSKAAGWLGLALRGRFILLAPQELIEDLGLVELAVRASILRSWGFVSPARYATCRQITHPVVKKAS
jgi:hypothetical protein